MSKLIRSIVNFFQTKNHQSFVEYVSKKSFHFQHYKSTIEYLAIGSSIADYSFNPRFFSLGKSFNLGLTSADLHTNLSILKQDIDEMSELKNVILFHSIFSNGFSLSETSENYRCIVYDHILGVNYSHSKKPVNLELKDKIFQEITNLSDVSFEEKYFGYSRPSYYGVNVDTLDRVSKHVRENKRCPSQLSLIKEINDLLNIRGIQLTIVMQDYRSDYLDLLPSKDELLRNLFELELPKVRYIDLLNSALFDDSDFGDCDHLNFKGARKLTKYLDKIL